MMLAQDSTNVYYVRRAGSFTCLVSLNPFCFWVHRYYLCFRDSKRARRGWRNLPKVMVGQSEGCRKGGRSQVGRRRTLPPRHPLGRRPPGRPGHGVRGPLPPHPYTKPLPHAGPHPDPLPCLSPALLTSSKRGISSAGACTRSPPSGVRLGGLGGGWQGS